MKKLILALFLLLIPTTSYASDLETRVRSFYTETVQIPQPSIVPFISIHGSYGFRHNAGGVGFTGGIDYENVRFMLTYDYIRYAIRSTHMISTETAYMFPLGTNFKLGPSIGIGYLYAPSHNHIFGTVGIVTSISLSQNWELTNRYRFVYNNSRRQEHIISSGITYRF